MPSVNGLPYFPLYVDDYLNDPAVLAMDADAEGCYIHLIAKSWRSPTPGKIPCDLIHGMGRLWRLEPERIAAVMDQLGRAFDTTSKAGYWVQKRMVVELRRAENLAGGRRRGADVTNRRRWTSVAERPSSDTLSDRSAVGNRDVDVEVDVDSEEEQRKKESPPKPPAASRNGVNGSNPDHVPLPEWITAETWADWCSFRRAFGRGAPWTPRAASLSVSKLTALRSGGNDPRLVVEQSILNGWRGLFPIRVDAVTKPSEPSDGLDRARALLAEKERVRGTH